MEEWVNKVGAFPYFARRLAIANRITPPPSRFLYKYKAIDVSSEASINYNRDILVESKLWLSSPSDFNDPFDMSVNVTIDGDGAKIRERFEAIMKERKVPWKERKRQSAKVAKQPREELLQTILTTGEDLLNILGVFSFAGDPRDILMWSHYADNHTGICIQFELAKDIRTFLQAIPVDYSDDYPTVNWLTDHDTFASDMGKVILRKYSGWIYEQERRIIRTGEAHTYMSFDPVAIRSIILGCRTSPEQIEVVQSIITERISKGLLPIPLYRVKQNRSNYELSIHKMD